jgi:hypothetical protein
MTLNHYQNQHNSTYQKHYQREIAVLENYSIHLTEKIQVSKAI